MKRVSGGPWSRRTLVAPRRGAWIETTIKIIKNPCAPVAPRRGAWIETAVFAKASISACVAPRRGAWIETVIWLEWRKNKKRRTPQGCVD